MISEPIKSTSAGSSLAGKTAILRRLWWWAPLLIAAAYLLTLAVQFNRLLASTYLSADVASAPVIGELFGHGPGHPQVLLGHLGWYSTLLFELGTRWLPLHRQIWEGAPYAMALASAALVGWGAWRVAGRWAAAIAISIVVCAGPGMLTLLLALNDHASTWFTLALLGAFVVALEQRADTLAGIWLAALAIGVGVLLGANAASDVLLSIAGTAPLLLAVGCTWGLHPSARTAKAATFALLSAAVALASGMLVHAWVHHENIFAASDMKTKVFVGPDSVGTNFKLWWQSLAVLGNGDFFGETLSFSSVLAFVCAALSIAAVLLVARATRSELAQAFAARREPPQQREQSVRLAWCVFWGSSLVALSAAFIFSGIPEDLGSSRYLVGAIYAGNQHLCGFELHFISNWYTPAPAMKTFLLSDPTYPAVPSAPTPDLGAPIAVHQIGAVTMYVYPYNVASRLYAL